MISVLGYEDFDVGIFLTTNVTIRKYNRTYRKQDMPTDILSFPFHPNIKPGEKIDARSEDEKNLGDIIISLEYVKQEAPKWNRSFKEHLRALVAHGIAHLLNYDHQTDKEYEVMQKVEKELLKATQKS